MPLFACSRLLHRGVVVATRRRGVTGGSRDDVLHRSMWIAAAPRGLDHCRLGFESTRHHRVADRRSLFFPSTSISPSPPPSLTRDIAPSPPLRYFSSSSSTLPPHTLFAMPALSPTMERGSISAWHKAAGDAFQAGDVLCTIDTDKASVDFEAQDDGILAKILVNASGTDEIAIGVPICVVVEDIGDVPAFADFAVEASAPSSTPVTASSAPSAVSQATTNTTTTTNTTPSFLMPSARHLSESRGLDATVLHGTGKGGRVTKSDVVQALQDGTLITPLRTSSSDTRHTDDATTTKAAVPLPRSLPGLPATAASPPPPAATTPIVGDLALPQIQTHGTFEDFPNNKMRKIIASRLTESKREVPHFYVSVQVELDAILKLRKDLASKLGIKVSVNDFVIRCSALALRDVPEVNGTIDPVTQSLRTHSNVDVSVAVATPTGLITPIVFHADQLGLSEITDRVRDLATRARQGKLAPHEYQGGTFSISNLGMFGVDEFSAVINPPQAAILAVGGGSRRLVPTPYREDPTNSNDPLSPPVKPSIRNVMTARLSADRRVVDEATGALFLSAFQRYANQPELLLL